MWPLSSGARLLVTRRFSTTAAERGMTRQEIVSHLVPVNRGALARDVASAGALTTAADAICQSLFEPRSVPFDTRRAMALGTFGAGYMGMFALQHGQSADLGAPQLATPAS